MLNNKQNKTLITGYSLVEMMIALAVLGLLLGGALVPLTARYHMEQYNTAREQVEEAKEAVLAYAVHHLTTERVIQYYNGLNHVIPSGRPYLPCPDVDNDGLEDREPVLLTSAVVVSTNLTVYGVCEEQKGLLPWKTLGIKDADIWGNRLTYAVDEAFSNQLFGFDETFKSDVFDRRKAQLGTGLALNDNKDESGIIICSDFRNIGQGGCPRQDYTNINAGIVVTSTITTALGVIPLYTRNSTDVNGVFDGAVFVVLSHGKNGGGATNRYGACQQFSSTATRLGDYYNDEANAYYAAAHPLHSACTKDAPGSLEFYENTFVNSHIAYSANKGNPSDDIVVWAGGNELIGYLLGSGSLPIEKLDFLP